LDAKLFKFFLLGHKFIAHRRIKDVKNSLLQEARETQRKIAWKDAIEDNANGVMGVNLPNYAMIRKGTEPPAIHFDVYDEAITTAVDFATKRYVVAMNFNRWTKDRDASEWAVTFRKMKQVGRFVACDKNLGVRFIPLAMYRKYVDRERKNYDPRSVEYCEPQKMDKLFKDFLHEQHEGLKSIVAKMMIHGPKSEVYYRVRALREMRSKGALSNQTKLLCAFAQVIEMIGVICSKSEEHDIPKLQLLLKVHKGIGKDGLFPTRPIIPNCRLPGYILGKWVSKIMTKMVKQIPWALESTQQFTEWIGDSTRGPRVRCYDFTNLYGCEPVKETIDLFQSALEHKKWDFGDDDDARISFEMLMTTVTIPMSLMIEDILGDNPVRLFTLIIAFLVRHTIAKIHDGEDWRVVMTFDFLAMGCPPVAPLSIITLAYLEEKALGATRCERGMRRLIDDIVLDEDIISEAQLRSIYPRYLTLNYADDNHYLDVSFKWTGKTYATWPYVKPNATIPLNFYTMHPIHTVRAVAENELRRLMTLCSDPQMRTHWAEFWYRKYSLADYPIGWLSKILERYVSGRTKVRREGTPRDVNHIEKFRGVKTKAADYIDICVNWTRERLRRKPLNIAAATSVETSLLRMALKEPRASKERKTGSN